MFFCFVDTVSNVTRYNYELHVENYFDYKLQHGRWQQHQKFVKIDFGSAENGNKFLPSLALTSNLLIQDIKSTRKFTELIWVECRELNVVYSSKNLLSQIYSIYGHKFSSSSLWRLGEAKSKALSSSDDKLMRFLFYFFLFLSSSFHVGSMDFRYYE